MFFESWMGLLRTVVIGVCAYASLIVLLRVSRKRTLSKMNAFDLIVTVALGSTLATIMLSPDTPLAEGVTAMAVLVFLQFVITWLSVRVRAVDRFVKAEPRLLFHRGGFLRQAMKSERVTEGEVLQGMRSHGYSNPSDVGAVVLETDGSLSILGRVDPHAETTLGNVRGADAP